MTMAPGGTGLLLAALALLAIFLPGFLLLVASLPFANRLATLPVGNFSANGDVLVSVMGKGAVKDAAREQEAN